jgi:predicted small secreted protein
MKRSLTIFVLSALLAGPVTAQTIGEDIKSQNLCRQAVDLAKQRNEDPVSYASLKCDLKSTLPIGYWECLVETMKKGPSLADASASCRA